MPETTTPNPAPGVAAANTPAGGVADDRTATKADRTVLLAALADSVLAVPGVAWLEPTLSTAGPGLLIHRDPTDGVRVLIRSGTAQVDISIATRADCQARTIAHQIQASTTRVLLAHGHPISSVTVSVLTIEPIAVA